MGAAVLTDWQEYLAKKYDRPRDLRAEMLRETSEFLSLALRDPRMQRVRIPARPVEKGGFREILSRPGARALAHRFWTRTWDLLDEVEQEIRDRKMGR